MPMRLNTSPNMACSQSGVHYGQGMAGTKGMGGCGAAGKGATATTAAWTGGGGGGGACALGSKGATTVAFTVGGTGATGGAITTSHGFSLGLGLGLGAWGPVLLGASVLAIGGYLYSKRNQPTCKPAGVDELAAVLAGIDL